MRYYWIQDKITQQAFVVYWEEGVKTLLTISLNTSLLLSTEMSYQFTYMNPIQQK